MTRVMAITNYDDDGDEDDDDENYLSREPKSIRRVAAGEGVVGCGVQCIPRAHEQNTVLLLMGSCVRV